MRFKLCRVGVWGLFATIGLYATLTVKQQFPGVPVLIYISLGWVMGTIAHNLSKWLESLMVDEDEGIELDDGY